MSIRYSDSHYINDDGTVDWDLFVEENRERVEQLAESDRQSSWVCQRLLNYVEDGESS